jgi:hypothetical protein
LYAVSCTTTPASLCVAIDDLGSIVTSTNPIGGASAWTETKIDSHTLFSVSCARSTLCVATDAAGDVVTSTNPTGGASAWKVTSIDGTNYLYGVSCTVTPSTLCVAVDNAGQIFASTNPTGGSSTWKTVDSGGGVLSAVSCATATLCAAVDTSGYILTSTNPTAGASAWSRNFVDTNTNNALYGVSCTTNPSTLCVAVDAGDYVWTSTNPAGGVAGWTGAPIESTSVVLDAVSCATTTLCVAADGGGDLLTSTNPTGGLSAWTATQVEPCINAEKCGSTASGIPINGVSCPSTSLCLAADSGGNVIVGSGAPPPTTSVLIPATGAKLSGTASTLDASATNAASVEFWLLGGSYGYSGKMIGTATLTVYGWVSTWNTTSVPNNSYALVSEAVNSSGSAFSTPVSITVSNTT